MELFLLWCVSLATFEDDGDNAVTLHRLRRLKVTVTML